MKILSAQLSEILERIAVHEPTLEEIARLLAQAAIGEGTIFIAAFGEMKAVAAAALESTEPLPSASEWKPDSILTSADRVFILAKKDEGDELAGRLSDAAIPFAMISAESHSTDLPEVFLSLGIDEGISAGGRTVIPHPLAALYAYYNIKLMMGEMLDEENY
ncbi:DUF2529 family protein [Planomicrobium sp. MB-3u-38]|uniref:DUF2529 family protein n=1 Tax=Planomicrobium sp. MB-3u-38 TaxID=2058318 RepID=UPI000C7B37BF|nr:DUF2529 family protein [Planomicrobium sp. MB-3u-38]PKH11854.1 DUF2529 domain-containing protein [Planomicrobium sp. MB-3u-38]